MESVQTGTKAETAGLEVEVKKTKPVVASNKVPKELLEDKLLNELIKVLPSNYNFEIHKSIWRINETKRAIGKDVARVADSVYHGASSVPRGTIASCMHHCRYSEDLHKL